VVCWQVRQTRRDQTKGSNKAFGPPVHVLKEYLLTCIGHKDVSDKD